MRELYDLLMGQEKWIETVDHIKANYEEYENIVEEGSTQKVFFVILKGKVRVRLQAGKEQHEQMSIIELSAGDTFGEMAIFYPSPASASVVTMTSSELLKVDIASFEKYLDDHPDVGYKVLKIMLKSMCERLRHSNKIISQLVNWGKDKN